MRKWRWPEIFCGAALVVILPGCAAPAQTRLDPLLSGSPVAATPASPDKRVFIAPELQELVKLRRVIFYTTRSGFLKIQVDLQNLSAAPLRFNYRIFWYDKEGSALPNADTDAIPWMLLGKETSSIAVTAPTESAVDFSVAFSGIDK
jgi:uncharacterized protein YcfL